ncbi:hypothetical protein HX744_13620 [Pseudonocardia sp. ICBG1122]|nr:hypothetical protein [Pseudonocardia pini]
MNRDRVLGLTMPVLRPAVRMLAPLRRADLAALPVPDGRVVLFGDSITEAAEWDELLSDLPTANRGIGGDTTVDLLDRLGDGVGRPRAISLLIGTNDLHAGPRMRRPAGIADRVEDIVGRLRRAHPDAILVVNGLTPRTGLFAPRIRQLATLYRRIAEQHGARFLDPFPLLADAEGNIRPEYAHDRLHLTTAGYRVWCTALRPLLDDVGPALRHHRGPDRIPEPGSRV